MRLVCARCLVFAVEVPTAVCHEYRRPEAYLHEGHGVRIVLSKALLVFPNLRHHITLCQISIGHVLFMSQEQSQQSWRFYQRIAVRMSPRPAYPVWMIAMPILRIPRPAKPHVKRRDNHGGLRMGVHDGHLLFQLVGDPNVITVQVGDIQPLCAAYAEIPRSAHATVFMPFMLQVAHPVTMLLGVASGDITAAVR